MMTVTRSPGYAEALTVRSELVELLREGVPLGRGGPALTPPMLLALSEEIAHRPPAVFTLASTSMGSALVQVGHVLEWHLADADVPFVSAALSVAVTWDLDAIRELAPAALDPASAHHTALLRPDLHVNLRFRPFAITSLFVAAPGSLILQKAG